MKLLQSVYRYPKYQSIKTTNFETQIERDFNKGKNRPNRTHSSWTLGCLKGLTFPQTNLEINKET